MCGAGTPQRDAPIGRFAVADSKKITVVIL
jgi:hypothetical protein